MYIRYIMVSDGICNKSYVCHPKHCHYIKYDCVFIMQLLTSGYIQAKV